MSIIADLFVWFATVCAIFHVVFGGLDLSLLIFMDALDALNIFVRYAVSAVTCQIKLWMQLVVVRHELRHQKPRIKQNRPRSERAGKHVFECVVDTGGFVHQL